jgi:XrtJ-associated TM-motif-TM protein
LTLSAFGQYDRRDLTLEIGRKRTNMKRSALFFVAAVFILLVAVPLRAQTGCTDSPEDPTIVLALVASAGALFPVVRAHLRARRNPPKR